jgi:triosephosphate isomerase (TIM)
MKKRLVIANWKMYIESPEAAKKFSAGLRRALPKLKGVEAWVAPAYTLLPTVAAALKGSTIKVGGQALSAQSGAHTSEVSGRMLKQVGASFTIVGHSERRAAGTSNEDVRAQLVVAAEAGLVPVLCIGELERPSSTLGASDRFDHFSYVEEQLRSALGAGPIAKLMVAYEPVWAIGKSADAAMQPAEVEEMVIFIRKTLANLVGRETADKTTILYGGSVEPENADLLIKHGGVGGFLVGHASAELQSFLNILKACQK